MNTTNKICGENIVKQTWGKVSKSIRPYTKAEALHVIAFQATDGGPARCENHLRVAYDKDH